jgi:antitoxin component of MazEF toxin-antitoxin module
MLLDSVHLTDSDTVDVIAQNDSIIIKKAEIKRRHKTIQERLAGFEGVYAPEEWDTGAPVGNEEW